MTSLLFLIRTFWPLVLVVAAYAFVHSRIPIFDPKSSTLGVAILLTKFFVSPLVVFLAGIPVCIFLRAKHLDRRLKFRILAVSVAGIAALVLYTHILLTQ